MKSFQRTMCAMLLPMAVLLPLWLTLGRSIFGSVGWLMLIFIFTLAPALLALLLGAWGIVPKFHDAQGQRVISRISAMLFAVVYGLLFLFGIFIVDFGDTQDSSVSVAANILGRWFLPASSFLAVVTFFLAFVALIALYVFIIRERILTKNTTPSPASAPPQLPMQPQAVPQQEIPPQQPERSEATQKVPQQQ